MRPIYLSIPFEGFLAHYPRQSLTKRGAQANTLIVAKGSGETLSIRPFYNQAEHFFRFEQKRFDYPSCAPHATQVWSDYVHWLDSLMTYSQADLDSLRERVVGFVLANLASHEIDPTSIDIDPPLFRLVLQGFDLSKRKNEPTGAALQGIVFGFLRADNPHLQIEVDKVRTGSKRLQRVGDVDGWDGGRLAISAEVKQYTLSGKNAIKFAEFANRVSRQGGIGIIAALGFSTVMRQKIEDLGLICLDPDTILNILALWDSVKQRIAVTSFFYYVRHVEKKCFTDQSAGNLYSECCEELAGSSRFQRGSLVRSSDRSRRTME